MLDAVKVLFILTGASTYLVTKYINVGMDSDQSINKTDHIKHFTQTGKFLSEISEEKMKAFWMHNKNISETLSDEDKAENGLLKDTKSSNDENTSKFSVEGLFRSGNKTFEQPVYEIQITEEETDLPKRLIQVKALTISKSDRQEDYQLQQQHFSDDIMFMLNGDGVDDENPSLSKFAINAFSGELYLISAIDRDPPNGRSQWRLNITAEDDRGNKLEGSASIVVNVRDINDNVPYFLHHNYYGNVSENSASGVEIMTLTAEDADENNAMKYSIELNRVNNEGELIFEMDESSGALCSAVCCLDRESIDHYVIKVCASDGGSAKACATVVVHVLDDNDEAVRFAKKDVSVVMGERDIYAGKHVVNLTVADNDLLQTNKFVYKILNHSHYAKYFAISANSDGSGNVRIAKKFSLNQAFNSDYLENQMNNYNEFSLTIAVSDIGIFTDETRVDYCRLTIKVQKFVASKSSHEITDSFVSHSGQLNEDNSTASLSNKTNAKILSLNSSINYNQQPNVNFSFQFPFGVFQELTVFYLILIATIIVIISLIVLLLFIKIRHYYRLSSKLSTNRNESNNRKNSTENSSETDLRDAVRSYDYEGGGECDISFYDLTQLQIPINMIASPSLATTKSANINCDLKCESMQKVLLLPDVCTKSRSQSSTTTATITQCAKESETINIFVVE